MEEFDDELACVQDELQIDYKQLALEVARQISPDIQETLATIVTNRLRSRMMSQKMIAVLML